MVEMMLMEFAKKDVLHVTCVVNARVLEGNPKTVGKKGGLSGDSVGDIRVKANSAAVDPRQFGGKAFLRTIRNRISGVTAQGQRFEGVSDIIGAKKSEVPEGFSNIRDYLRHTFPGKFLLELVNGNDEGITEVTIRVGDPLFDCGTLTL